jgi:hypothetical protein
MIPALSWYRHDMVLVVLSLSGTVSALILTILRKALMLTQYHDSECVKVGNETRTIERPYLQQQLNYAAPASVVVSTLTPHCVDIIYALHQSTYQQNQ